MTGERSPAATVSLIVRTVGRPELREALDSIAQQSYPHCETLVVDALGDGVPCLAAIQNPPSYTLISDGQQHDRASAGNLGLDACRGEFVLFLDDDDWIGKDHLQNLVPELRARNEAIAVYSSTQKTLKDGTLIPEFFAEEFSAAVLRRDNFMPIHSVLFRRRALDEGCRLDTSLPIYEDWDFWLQLAELGEFFHIDTVSAFYRGGGDSETPVAEIADKYRPSSANAQARTKVLEKWVPRWSGEQLNSTFGSLDRTAEIFEQQRALQDSQANFAAELDKHHLERRDLANKYESRISEELSKQEALRQQLLKEENEHEESKNQLRELDAEVNALRAQLTLLSNSWSWKLTKPLRFIARKLRGGAPASQVGRADSNPESTAAVVPELRASVDSPAPEITVCSEDLLLEGWAFSAAGPVQIEVVINGVLYCTLSPSRERIDVGASFPEIESARHSGFRTELLKRFLPEGKLNIALHFNDGFTKQTVNRSVVKLSAAEHYRLWIAERAAFVRSKQVSHSEIAVLAFEPQQLLTRDINEGVAALLASIRTACNSHSAVMLVAEDEYLRHDAVDTLSSELNSELSREALNAELVYSDHDLLDADGSHCQPEFTFGWSGEHLMGRDYVGGVYAFSSALFARCDTEQLHSALVSVIAKNPQSGVSLRYYLLLVLGSEAGSVKRVPQVLWSETQGNRSARQGFEDVWLAQYLSDREPTARVSSQGQGERLVRYVDRALVAQPLISIIIPTMGKLELIKPCMETLNALTEYSNYEVIILDNSRGNYPEGISYLKSKAVKLVECDFKFNWPQLNNIGVSQCSGEYLLFLNDDIEITDPSWLGELLKQAQRSEVGAVGPMLYYPEGKIQHAGVRLVNQGGGATHLFHKLGPSDSLQGRLHRLPREVSANTGACLLVSRAKFEEVGGFDESLRVVGNDIDLCLKLLSQGYVNIWTPRSALIHHESISRKATEHPEDEATMWQRWGDYFNAGDSYYNPNLGTLAADCAPELILTDKEKLAGIAPAHFEAAESASAQGVNLIGYIRAEMGLGEGARSDARALQEAGIDFGIINYELGNSARMGEVSWQHKEREDAPFDISLWHINADHLAAAQHAIPQYLLSNSYQIAFWAWELEVMPASWQPALELIDEIWVPSEFVREAIAKETGKPVVCIPHCVAPQPDPKLDRDYFGLPRTSTLFLSMYDTRSVAERKNPKAALTAYLQAFPEADGAAGLVLKVNNSDAESLQALDELVGGRDDIILLTADHSKREIDSLIAACDCFVSLHRSEGFGLAPAESMALGKAVILSDWSGSQEYTRAEHCFPITCELVELERDYGPYKRGQRWADPDITEAAEAMRQIIAQPELAVEIGERARRFIEGNFSPKAIGEKMRARLNEIRLP